MVAEVARDQHGVITTAQLHMCGVGRGGIEKGTRSGRLHRVHVGVYAVGHLAPNRLARWHAAVLACGQGAALSHRSAATLWEIREAEQPRVDVTVPRAGTRRRGGILIHTSSLPNAETRVHRGIPVTSPARTALDVAHDLDDPDDVHRMLREMQYRNRFDRVELELANRRRASRLITASLDDLAATDSPHEDAFKSKVLRRYQLPEPLYQPKVEGFRVDFHWPEARLAVEIDGRNHTNPAMMQADHIRDNLLHLADQLVLRYTRADINRRHRRVADQILTAIDQRSA